MRGHAQGRGFGGRAALDFAQAPARVTWKGGGLRAPAVQGAQARARLRPLPAHVPLHMH